MKTKITLLRLIFGGMILVLGAALSESAYSAQQQQGVSEPSDAQKWIARGVEAYKNARLDEAIEDFQKAKELDPSNLNARLYLATAYSAEFIPGAPSKENAQNGERALREFDNVLQSHPDNLQALDGAASILYNLANAQFNLEKMEESKSYHLKHIELSPDDPEPYYWVGVIDWTIAFRANKEVRGDFAKAGNKPMDDDDPLSPAVTTQFQEKYGATIDEGITNLKKGISLLPEYEDAMAYLNLLYRLKADAESSWTAREEDLKIADDLVAQVKAIKTKKMDAPADSQ